MKTSTGSPVERAGLTNGKLYGIRVPGVATEPAVGIPTGRFQLADLGSRVGKTGAELEADSNTAGVTRFLRPEDGSWDPTNPNVFYFVTTNAFTAPSRLWRVTFDDVRNPTAGGTIEMALDGTEGQKMMDNITVDDRGNVLIQEDVGGNDHIGKVFKYFAESDTLTEVAHHDENRFAPGAPNFLTNDEESSGIIPAPFLGEGWYLLDVQAHYATDAETVEGGQLLALHVPPGRKK
jgi:secreted PhoX family phosphatase